MIEHDGARDALVRAAGKRVPLVRYDAAGRHVIGVALVNDDGTVNGTVDAATTAQLVEKDTPNAAPEFSLGHPRKHGAPLVAELDAVRAALIRARESAQVVAEIRYATEVGDALARSLPLPHRAGGDDRVLGIRVKVDPLLPPDVIELRDGRGTLLGTLDVRELAADG